MIHCSVWSPDEAVESNPTSLKAARTSRHRISTWAKARRRRPGESASTPREIARHRDSGRDGGDEYRGAGVPAPPVGGADGEPERAGDRRLHNDPDAPDEKRHRRRGEDRHHRSPRSVAGGERGERNDRQALKDRADERHEPAEHLEDEREVAEDGGLGELRRAQRSPQLVTDVPLGTQPRQRRAPLGGAERRP